VITKEDIRLRSVEWHLRVDVVEKDYVLGWLLAVLAMHPETSSQWVFKGGTCLKKCFFETYRFSEALDFSILPLALHSPDGILAVLHDVARQTMELGRIELPAEAVSIRQRPNGTFEGMIG